MNYLCVIPMYNEEIYIGEVLKKASSLDWDILVVDCMSTDRSRDIVANSYRMHPKCRMIDSPSRGLATGLITGFNFAINNGYELIATCDGDNEYEPEEIYSLKLLMTADTFAAVGERFDVANIPLKDKPLSLFLKCKCGINVSDPKSGARVYKTQLLKGILDSGVTSRYYGLSMELLIRGLEKGYSVVFTRFAGYRKNRERVLLNGDLRNREVMDIFRLAGDGDEERGRNALIDVCLSGGIDFERWMSEFDKGDEISVVC